LRLHLIPFVHFAGLPGKAKHLVDESGKNLVLAGHTCYRGLIQTMHTLAALEARSWREDIVHEERQIR